MVEGARLESVCTGNRTEGSNPSLSAEKIDYQSITEKAHSFTHINVKTVRFFVQILTSCIFAIIPIHPSTFPI